MKRGERHVRSSFQKWVRNQSDQVKNMGKDLNQRKEREAVLSYRWIVRVGRGGDIPIVEHRILIRCIGGVSLGSILMAIDFLPVGVTLTLA
ncbi:hypothetical protein GW17_00046315 [Ensete ventricosum]|nr:hypothetical protein GW17_00046315 [Ensete ventricosum]RZS01818.1 hypothetical protein BHM03_00031750 [Ensete ventricosum]